MKIDRDIPTPKEMPDRFPFNKLRKGDSFFVAESEAGIIQLNAVRLAAEKKFNKKFITRKEGNGRRVWRVS